MSDTNFPHVSSMFKFASVLDDNDWILATLSDDDIEIPKELQINEEEEEPGLGGDHNINEMSEDPEDVWDDDGLDGFHDSFDNKSSGINNDNQFQSASQSIYSKLNGNQNNNMKGGKLALGGSGSNLFSSNQFQHARNPIQLSSINMR